MVIRFENDDIIIGLVRKQDRHDHLNANVRLNYAYGFIMIVFPALLVFTVMIVFLMLLVITVLLVLGCSLHNIFMVNHL